MRYNFGNYVVKYLCLPAFLVSLPAFLAGLPAGRQVGLIAAIFYRRKTAKYSFNQSLIEEIYF
ncbi:MAG: hypothetical protein Q7U59_10160 [Lutibacter sp.]|nr:hypothetical protein [Lutibacter sp.]